MTMKEHARLARHHAELITIAGQEMRLCGIAGIDPQRLVAELGTDWEPAEFRRQVIAWCDGVKVLAGAAA